MNKSVSRVVDLGINRLNCSSGLILFGVRNAYDPVITSSSSKLMLKFVTIC
ncbi:MAG: hypothetical protein ACQEWI_06970 [Bacillota bacterium]